MALEQEPIADAIARHDRSIRWTWGEGAYPGTYDPGAFILSRGEQRYRGRHINVQGPEIAVEFAVQPIDTDEITAPAISEIAED